MKTFSHWLNENHIADNLDNLLAKYDAEIQKLQQEIGKWEKQKRQAVKLAGAKPTYDRYGGRMYGYEYPHQPHTPSREEMASKALKKRRQTPESMSGAWSSPIIWELYNYLVKNTHYDDPIDVRSFGLSREELERAVDEINQKAFGPSDDGSYSVGWNDHTVNYSHPDI